jgi:hypothetical protein
MRRCMARGSHLFNDGTAAIGLSAAERDAGTLGGKGLNQFGTDAGAAAADEDQSVFE